MPGAMRGRHPRAAVAHRDTVERAMPGTRTAVNITGIAKDDCRAAWCWRGRARCARRTCRCATARRCATLARPLRHNMNVTFHAFAAESSAQLRLLDCDELRAGDRAWAQFKLDTPMTIVRGDRFVLRTPNDTVGGGIVFDIGARRHKRNDAAVLIALEAKLSSSPADLVRDAVARLPLAMVGELAREVTLDAATIDDALDALAGTGELEAFGEPQRFATGAYIDRLRADAADLLEAWHREHPLRRGIPSEELRSRLGLDAPQFALAPDVLPGVRVSGGVAALAAFTPSLAGDERTEADAWLAALRRAPGSADVRAPANSVVVFLVESVEVVEVSRGTYVPADTLESLIRDVRGHIERDGGITLAQARDLFGTGRKQAQAILEYFDRTGVTRRAGDVRVLY